MGLGLAFYSSNMLVAEFAIRAIHIVSAFLPLTVNAICLSLLNPDKSIQFILKCSLKWLVAASVVSILCLSDLFLSGVVVGVGNSASIAEPVFGAGIILYGLHQFCALGVLVLKFVKDIRRAKGIIKVELQFVLLACIIGLFLGFINTLLLPVVFGSSQVVRFAPMSVLPFLAFIAYGIATRRIMEVGSVIRLLTAYGILLIYLAGLYALAFFSVMFLSDAMGVSNRMFPHFVAALVMAFSMTPAHGRMQNVASKLFVNVAATNVGLSIQRAGEVMQSIGTLDTLLSRFAEVVMDSVNTDRVCILIEDGGRYRQIYPDAASDKGVEEGFIQVGSPSIQSLKLESRPLVVDVLNRRNPTFLLECAGEELSSLGIAAAVGIRTKGDLRGVMLLGARLSGRVYGLPEQKALQIMADQLSIAVENASMFTELQDSKIYNEILLENLASGVIAADKDYKITVFNREAERITGLQSDDLIGKEINRLPGVLHRVFETTFSTGEGVRGRDIGIQLADEVMPVQISSSVFHGHAATVSGVLLVFSDLSRVKQLETQIRRTAHLASVGTLSAGMAHEIKNPLVTLKTFSQLLDEQYEDPEFRESFTELVGKEVNRIDEIVNQLLRFGRPAKAKLVQMSVQDVLEQCLKLIKVPMDKKNIDLKVAWHIQNSTISGDPRLLEQAFVNFLLNAVDAMEDGGELSVALHLIRQPIPVVEKREDILPDRHLSVSIRDSGVGIKQNDLPHVFDPFFTTKSSGTGLGLSIVHSIIKEHGGMIDLESEFGVGTTFRILLPIARM